MQIKVKEIKSEPSDGQLFANSYELGKKLAQQAYGAEE